MKTFSITFPLQDELFSVFTPLSSQHRPPLSLALTGPKSLLQCSVEGGGGGLLCSVETPISRTSRPAEGHSQSFGVKKEEGWAGQKQLRE